MVYALRPRWCALFGIPTLALGFLVALAEPAAAHSPHDEVMRIAADPRLPGHLFAVVRHILLVSLDLGVHWTRLSAGIWRHRLHDVAVVPDGHRLADSADLVAAGDDGALFRHEGEWGQAAIGPVHRILPTADGLVALTDGGDLLRCTDPTKLTDPTGWEPIAHAVAAVTTDDADLVIAGTDGRIHCDTRDFATIAREITALLPQADRLLVGTTTGLLAIDDNGAQDQLDDRPITSIATAGDEVMASLRNDGVLVSRDGGRRFVEANGGLTTDPQADEPGFDVPHFNQVLAAADGDGHRWFCAGFDGLFTTDDLTSWFELPDVLPRTLVGGLAKHGDDLLYSTYGAGIVRRRPDGTEHQENRGLRAKRLFAATPIGDGVILANHAQGALRSEDGGRSWADVALLRSADGQVRQRARLEQAARQTVYRVGSRLPSAALDRVRALYKKQRSTQPRDVRLPAFGAQIHHGDQSVFLASRTSGLYRLEGSGEFVRLRPPPDGEGLGMAERDGYLALLSPSGIDVRNPHGDWQHHERPYAGPHDRITVIDDNFFVATADGLFRSPTGQRWEPHPVGGRDGGVAVALAIADHGLVVQYDDGDLWHHGETSEPQRLAPPGTPVFRHAASFPDLTPMITADGDGLWASDQFSLFHLDPANGSITAVDRTMRIQADRPEVGLGTGWRVVTDPEASGGVTATTTTGALRFRFVGDGLRVLGHGPCTARLDQDPINVGADGPAIIDLDDLAPGLHVLDVTATGPVTIDAIEVHR